jgi:hypothetical protein
LIAFYLALFLVALVPAGLFAFWLYGRPWELKDKISAWDPFIKTMAIAGAVIVGLASFERFLDQRQQELVKDMSARAQSRKEAFARAIKATSEIATMVDLASPVAKETVASFWKLYWGELALYEGPTVAGAMVAFGRSLKEWQDSDKKPESMEILAIGVAHACKSESDTSDKEMDALRDRYSPF